MRINRPWRTCGFSLAETLVVMALLAVLLGLAVPGLTNLRSRHEVQAVAEEVRSSLMLARSQALMHQQRVVLCPVAVPGTCDTQGRWQQGWLVFVDGDHSGQREGQELVLQSRGPLPRGVLLQGNSTVSRGVRYGADGLGEGLGGTFILCSAGVNAIWKVVVNALGRPRMEKSEAPDCA